MRTRFKHGIENIKKFSLGSFYNEYKILLKALILIDAFFVIALAADIFLKMVQNISVTYFLLILFTSLFGIVATVIIYIFFYFLIVLPSIRIEDLKERYSLKLGGTKKGYFGTVLETLELTDKITKEEYSAKLIQKQAELEAMKNQINPHFLYNTLDTIRGYASMENAPITGNMIEILSHLFRYTVSSKQGRVTIVQEVGIAREYLKIQEYRINVKIQMIEIIEDDVRADEYYVPKMILQPIIENAIQHGMRDDAVEFIVTLHIYRTQSRVVISIKDSGVGMSTQTVAKLNQRFMENPFSEKSMEPLRSKSEGKGIGLQNINKRIKLMFGEQYGLYCYSSLGEGSVFEISLPAGK